MKQAIMLISLELIANIGTGRFETIENRLPDDARVVSGVVNGQELALFIESDTFEDIKAGQPIPTLLPAVIRRIQETA